MLRNLILSLIISTVGIVAMERSVEQDISVLNKVNYDIIRISGEINEETVILVEKGIQDAVDHKKDLFIKIDSPGGSVVSEITIASMIKEAPIHITTFADGLCASAAAMILSSGDTRIASPNSLLLTHYASGAGSGGTEAELEKNKDFMAGLNRVIESQLANNLHMTVAQVRERFLKQGIDFIMTAEEGLALGLITSISVDPLNEHPRS